MGLEITQTSYLCTFRIYPTTIFSEIKRAACEFWSKIDQQFILTDKYYNNLSSYTDTVMNFFKASYMPINHNGDAIIYLVSANQKVRDLHKFQLEGIALGDKKGKGEGDAVGG